LNKQVTISFDQAKVLAEKTVGALGAANGYEFVITGNEAIEAGEGWVERRVRRSSQSEGGSDTHQLQSWK
jgi:hypothetical protein